MDVYPLFLKLADRKAVLVGGGHAAARKAEFLLRAGSRLTVVAEELSSELAEAVLAGKLRHLAGPLLPEHFRGATLAVVATDDQALARRAAALAEAAGVPVNVVDRPELSSFIAPAVVDRSPVLVAISTGGASPLLAREVRLAIERLLPASLGRLARFARQFRAAAQAAIPGALARRRFWEQCLKGAVADAVLAGDDARARTAMLALVNRAGNAGRTGRAGGIVHLVGAGPGDPELLTLRAHRLLNEADAIVHDRLVDPRVLELARRDAERIPVGKAKGRHSLRQDEINGLLVELAARGQRVVRLKGGDPFIFGRGGEELEALRAHGIAVEVVPGISAALGCAAAAQIPLTHRAYAGAVTFVSAQASAGGQAVDWAALARLSGTIAVYMGAGEAQAVARELTAHGLDPSTPVAVIENGTRADERIRRTTLAELGRLAAAYPIAAPALMVIGEVAAFARAEGAESFALAASA
ncbi:MAG TPA: siroheme synthase CysG [Alphaproteobacteria bacterium]|nr:siroheme synthase CysG [Alphaproteobacteria bacterium]